MSHPTRLSVQQRSALACVLDAIIPPSRDGRLPGAGALGLAEGLAQQAELHEALVAGLDTLDELARARGADGFATIEPGDRRALLEESAAKAPGFLPAVVAQTLVAYYQEARVLEALGFETRPPFPLGYAVEPTDFAILAPVRVRAPFYRRP